MSERQHGAGSVRTAHEAPAVPAGTQPEADLGDEVVYHDRVRAAIAAMRRSAVDAVDEFHSDFEEGKKNRFAR